MNKDNSKILYAIANDIYLNLLKNNEGNVANYIPQLEKINPDLFGISICTVNGDIINIGDTSEFFCLQSLSKPLSYCIARQYYSSEYVHSHVGYEPSGRSFNAFELNNNKLPYNPLINAGAIMISSLILPDNEPSYRFETVNMYYQKLCGNINKVGFDNSVYLSEQHHADRNISLAYYMRENNIFEKNVGPKEIEQHLNLYFQCCSVTINSKMGSVIAATLANGGVSPITNENIFEENIIRDCLSLMYMCGMYNYSGQFAFEVGLPAKSGVSGALFLVVPNKMGICIWSPRLDNMGNSVRGVEFAKQFIKRYPENLHIFNTITNKDFLNNNSELVLQQRIINASAIGDLDTLKLLISNYKVDLNISDYDLRTPLHLACSEGKVKIVKYLLEKGVNSKPKDRWGNTPIFEIKLLLNKNNNSNNYNYLKIKDLLENHIDKSDYFMNDIQCDFSKLDSSSTYND